MRLRWGRVPAGMRRCRLERPERSARRCVPVPRDVPLLRNVAAGLHGTAFRLTTVPLAGPRNANRRCRCAVPTLLRRLGRPGVFRSFHRTRPIAPHAPLSPVRANARRNSRPSAAHSAIHLSINARSCRPSLLKRLAGQFPAQARLAEAVDPQRSREQQKRPPKRHKTDEGAKSTTL